MGASNTPSSTFRPVRDALGGESPLGSLLERVTASRECLAAIAPLLPEGLIHQVRPGPLDERGWTLLATHAAAAAKLRQLVPALQARLQDHGRAALAVRIKVLPP